VKDDFYLDKEMEKLNRVYRRSTIDLIIISFLLSGFILLFFYPFISLFLYFLTNGQVDLKPV